MLQPGLQCSQPLACCVNASISSHMGFQPEPVGFCHLAMRCLHLHLQAVHLLLQLLALQVCSCSVLR